MQATTHNALEVAAVTRLHTYRSMARRIVANEDDAHDVVQEAFLNAQRNLDQFSGRSQFTTWLGKIVINCAKMQRRRTCVHVRISPEAEQLVFAKLPDRTANAHEDMVERSRSAWLAGAVATLPSCLRRSVELKLQGLTDRQIADALGCPVGTVKARMNRARVQLVRRARKAGF